MGGYDNISKWIVGSLLFDFIHYNMYVHDIHNFLISNVIIWGRESEGSGNYSQLFQDST